jgi:hypothetical protein
MARDKVNMLSFECKYCGNRGICSRDNMSSCPFDGHVLEKNNGSQNENMLYMVF